MTFSPVRCGITPNEPYFGLISCCTLADQTIKAVKIRDRRLGLLKLLFMLVILLYVVVFQIVRNTGPSRGARRHRCRPRLCRASRPGYLKKEAPVGTVRFSLLRPLANPHCDTPDCPSAFKTTTEVRALGVWALRASSLHTPLLPQLPYCTDYTGHSPSSVQLDCNFLDALDMVVAQEKSFLITTRVSEMFEVCTLADVPPTVPTPPQRTLTHPPATRVRSCGNELQHPVQQPQLLNLLRLGRGVVHDADRPHRAGPELRCAWCVRWPPSAHHVAT